MTNTKRIGRYRNHSANNNHNDHTDNSKSSPYFNELVSFYKENSRKSLLDWDNPLFGHKRTSLEKVLVNTNKVFEKSTRFINKIKLRQLACANRVKSIPENATIKKEYIKCGKQICEQKHGPYYYAYWKDPESKKLKKKYIGGSYPKDQQFKGNRNNNNDKIL